MAKRSGGTLSDLSVADLEREISRRRRSVGGLLRRRDKLAAKLAALESEIATLGGAARGKGRPAGARKRPANEMSLVECLYKVLEGKTMSVSEAAEAVLKSGYQSSSPKFNTIVNQALINKKNRFEKKGRGLYTVK
ncbi:MAG: hypothetical protein C0475_07595 [Planctomyces sp.]|nr:hypothetical protein [Planctomyces sp.]MBA4039600.1 hypothetical protein [Planctomyces sp.]